MWRQLSSIIASLGVIVGAAAIPSAWAQSPPAPTATNKVIPEKQKPGRVKPPTANAGGNLSDKLSKSNGIIKPPSGIDPGINQQAPAPHPNSTPVIPPPGARGGKVQPK